jgi:hypothetical protein
MRITKKNVLIEYSGWSQFYGAYVQGATHGRVVAYPIEEAKRVLGMDVTQLRKMSAHAPAPGYTLGTIAEVLETHLGPGRVIRRGYEIE